jgi:hypothetical protein
LNPDGSPADATVPIDRAVRRFTRTAWPLLSSAAATLPLSPDRTGVAFSWTTRPPLTADWLGAGYAAALVARAAALRRTRASASAVAAGL